MRKKGFKKFLSLLLSVIMCLSVIPTQALAKEVSTGLSAGNWKMQAFGGTADLEIPEGAIVPEENGTGFTADYSKIFGSASAPGGNVVIYYDSAERYTDSVLEFTFNMLGEENNRYRLAVFPHFVNGQNCDGIAIDTPASIQHSYRINNGEGWPGLSNLLGVTFEHAKDYRAKFVTKDGKITMYLNRGQGYEKLAETGVAGTLNDTTFGFRMWGPQETKDLKKLQIKEVSFRAWAPSQFTEEGCEVADVEWGKSDLNISMQMNEEDSVVSVKNGETVLTAGTDYVVENGQIILKASYIEAQAETFTLTAEFAGGSSDAYVVTKVSIGPEGIWKMQNFGEETDLEIQKGWLTADEEGTGFTLDYGKLYTDRGNVGSVVVYDPTAPVMDDSVLELDVDVTGGNTGRFSVAFFPRFTSGKNCDGMAVDTSSSLQHAGRENGQEYWPGVENKLNYNFEQGKTHHLKFITVGNQISVYVNDELLTSFGTRGQTEGRYGFRIWGQEAVRNVHISNITRRAYVASGVDASGCKIEESEWGTMDVQIPFTLGDGDRIASVKNGNVVLTKGTDYVIDSENNKIVIKKEYIAAQENSFSLTIDFAGGVQGVYTVTKKAGSFVYADDFTDGDVANWVKKSGNGTVEAKDGALHVKGDTVVVDTLSPLVQDGEAEFVIEPQNDNGRFGLVFRAGDDGSWQSFYNSEPCRYQYATSGWNYMNNSGTNKGVLTDGTNILLRPKDAGYTMKVRFVGKTLTVWMDGNPIYSGDIGEMGLNEGHIGIQTGGNADILLKKVTYRNYSGLDERGQNTENVMIANGNFHVTLAGDFPRVIGYELDGKTLDGCVIPKNYVSVNGTDYPAAAELTSNAADKAVYAVTVDMDGEQTITFNTVFTAKEHNVLDMQITDIKENGYKLYTLGFPEQPMISAKNSDEGAAFNASTRSGDKNLNLAGGAKAGMTATSYAEIPFITANGLSASMYNNVYNNRMEFSYRTFELAGGDVTTGVWNTDFFYRGLDGKRLIPESENPFCQVVVTGDTDNGDDAVNWQDGANALKSYVMGDVITGGDKVRSSMIHVGYNFVSEAQQPFLKIADNYKRFGNLIDDFDQILVLKGYANEGHDSGHADYADINKRAGGAEDLSTMSQAIKDAGLGTFGVHLNHSEAYPEAEMFTNDVMSTINGWKWMDQSKYIRREVDIQNGGMDSRLNTMFSKASSNGTTPGIGFVYVDTYRDDRYAAARLAQNITGHDAALGTEEGGKLDRWNAWVHWPANYGEIHRFVYNSQKDVYNDDGRFWGGYNRSTSMMSWQHNWNVNNLVSQFYTSQLPQKYLMNHEVVRLADGYAYFENGVKAKDHQIWKDDKLVVGNGGYFVPWYGENNETKNPDAADKIYYWCNGGTKTWDLPNEEWAGLATVKLYKNTQTGKEFVKDIPVSNGQVTIDGVSANTPYVIYKGEAAAENTQWSTGSPIKDTGFNSRDFSIWKKSGEADIAFNDDANGVSILTMSGTEAGQVSQVMTGLEAGQKYRALVWAGAENGKTAHITVKQDGKIYDNYMDQVVRSNDCFDTYAKGKRVFRMWVDFTAVSETAEIILSADACENSNGKATFMESRIVKTADPGFPTADPTKHYVAYENFEYVEQGGTGIFTPEGGGDGGYHISHYREGYTDDAIGINGSYSLKMKGYGSANMRTYPATMRLMPNTEYTMEFDVLGNGNVEIVSETDGSDKPLSKAVSQGHGKITFTTGDKTDYIARFTGITVLDNFEVYGIADETAPTVPTELAAEVAGDNSSVTLTWKASEDADTGVSAYVIYRNGEEYARVGNVTVYTDTKVAPDTTYTYQVSAVNGGGTESEKSNEAKAVIGADKRAPEVVKLTRDGEKFVLTFNEVLDRESAENVSNYRLSGGASAGSAVLGENGKTVTLTVKGMTNVDEYVLRIVGVKDVYGNATDGTEEFTVSNLVRYLKLDETSGLTAKDETLHGDGTKADTVKVTDGKFGKAAKFESNGYIDLQNTTLSGLQEYAVSLWVKWDGTANESKTIFSNNTSGDGSSPGVWLRVNGGGIVTADNINGGGVASSKGLPVDEWAHLVLVRKNSGTELYMNGEKIIDTDRTIKLGDNKFRIGGNFNGNGSLLHKFGGAIDEFKIFSTALTADEVQKIYESEPVPVYIITVNGEEVARGVYNTKVTVTAPEASEGQIFAGWLLNGQIVSKAESYTFYISEDMELTPCYDADKKMESSVLMTNYLLEKRADTKGNAKFVAQVIVPDNCKVKRAGLVWSTSDGAALELNKGFKETNIRTISNTNQFSVTIKGVPGGRFVRGRLFAVITDAEGNETIVYSEEQKVTN